jgi:hypothetical protein
MDKPNIAEMIIQYEKDKDMNDTQFAFESHLSVERVHNLKSGDYEATKDEKRLFWNILNYINNAIFVVYP